MKTTLLRLSRRAACLVLAGGLLTSCSLLPAASPRHEGTASSQAPQYYSDAWLSDDSLHYLYSYAGNGGGTILRGGRVLYKASSSDSIQLLKDTLTGETDHYLVAHSILGTEERTSTLYDADGNPVMTFPYAVNATLSGGLLILRDDADVWASENGTTGGTRVYDLATGAQLPVPETALDCLVVDEGGQRLVFNCYDLPEGLTYAYDDPDQKLHQYVLITDREGNVLMREDGCTASTLASYRGGFADWLDLSWFRSSDWGITREALYNVTTGELLTGEDDSAVSACGVGVACLQSRQDSRSVLYDLNGGEAVELGRFDRGVNTYSHLHHLDGFHLYGGAQRPLLVQRRAPHPPLPRRPRGHRRGSARPAVSVRRHVLTARHHRDEYDVPVHRQVGPGYLPRLLPSGRLLHPAHPHPAPHLGPERHRAVPAHRRWPHLLHLGAFPAALPEGIEGTGRRRISLS